MFRTKISVLMLLVMLSMLPTATVSAADLLAAKSETALLTGYGITHRNFGATRTQVQTWDAIARYGLFLSDQIGQGSWFQGRHQLLLELPLHLALDHGGRSMTGGYMLGSWKFTSLKDLAPYVLAGGGILFVDLGLPTMGSRLDFSYQGGTGVQYFFRKDTALMAEYRYHHISNAGTAAPNEPLNSSKFLIGISFFH